MAGKATNCDDKLSKTQVRNPRLPKPSGDDHDSMVESVPWSGGEAMGVSIFSGFIVSMPFLLVMGLADIALPVPSTAFTAVPVIFMLVFFVAMFCVRIAPSRRPPLELGTVERKEAWQKFHALPLSQQSDVRAAFDIYMDADVNRRVIYAGAQDLWNQTYRALQERERLLTSEPEDATDYRLDQAKQDLNVLEGTIQQLKEYRGREEA